MERRKPGEVGKWGEAELQQKNKKYNGREGEKYRFLSYTEVGDHWKTVGKGENVYNL